VVVLPTLTVTGEPWDDTSYNVPNASTATKTDTPIMETPYSIQVVPQQVLQDQQVFRLEKALQNVSGVIRFPANQNSTDQFLLRGFDNQTYYRDGFRFDASSGGTRSRDTANLERIEVLKGPGSILYGRAEPGGIINLVTKQPLATAFYGLQQQFGSFDFYRTAADATGPLTKDDTLLYRFNLAYENAGSFRELVEGDRVFLAPALRWNPSDRTQVNFELEYSDLHQVAEPGVPVFGNRPAPVPRERNLMDPYARIDNDRVLVGLNWSHAFDEHWTLRHRFNAHLGEQDNVVLFYLGTVGSDGTINRGLQFARNDSDAYYNALDLTGHFDTRGLTHALLIGGDYYRSSSNDNLGGTSRSLVTNIL